MTALAGADRARLAKVLCMLSSPHQGEREAAAAAADRMVRGAGLTWDAILCGDAKGAEPKSAGTRADAVAVCTAHASALTAWEIEFLAGIQDRPRLTPKQAEKLAVIAARFR